VAYRYNSLKVIGSDWSGMSGSL